MKINLQCRENQTNESAGNVNRFWFSPSSVAGRFKLHRFVYATFASLILINSPLATAQEKIQATGEAKLTAEVKAVPDKKSAANAHAEALQFARNGDNAKAAEVLAPYAKQPMANVPITGDYLVFTAWSGDNQRATKAFEDLPATFPKSSYLMRNMAKAYYDQGNFGAAIKLYTSTLKLTPADDEAQKGHVLSLFHDGKKADAATKLNEYLKTSPDSIALQHLKPQIIQ